MVSHQLLLRLFFAIMISVILAIIVGHFFRDVEITKEATSTTVINNNSLRRDLRTGEPEESSRINYHESESFPFNTSLAVISGLLCFSILGVTFVIIDKKNRKI